jgi:hypothetical protein
MGARWYNGRIGRWVSADTIIPDPTNPQAFSRYTYVDGNPLRYMDPTGHSPCGLWCPGDTALDPQFDRYYSYDLTPWLVNEMAAATSSPEIHMIQTLLTIPTDQFHPVYGDAVGRRLAAYYLFIQLVTHSAKWDSKIEIQDTFQEAIVLGGEWLEYSVPGNIFFSYVGRAAGFTLGELQIGAGIAEITDPNHDELLYIRLDWISTMFDDPMDAAAVEFGSALYDAYGTTMTVEDFENLMVDHSSGLLHATPPMLPEVHDGWPYPPGHFRPPGDPQ